MKKAIFILEDLNGTGSPLTVLHIIKNISPNIKITVLVLCGHDENDLSRRAIFEEQKTTIHIMTIPHLFGRKFKILYHFYLHKIKKRVSKLLKMDSFDYVYINRFNIAGPISSLVKRKSKNSTIVFNSLGNFDIKSSNFYVNALFNSSLKKICSCCDYYVSISEQCFTKMYPIKGTKIILHDYSDIEAKTSDKTFNKKGIFHLGQIGYFSDNKNQLFSLCLIKKLLDRGYDASLYLIGYPTDLKYFTLLKAYINDNNLNEHILLFDRNHDKASFFDNVDLLLIPSKSEGFPLIIKESLSQKTPVLGSNALPPEAKFYGVKMLNLNDSKAWEEFIINETYKEQIPPLDIAKDRYDFKNIINNIFK